MADELKRVGLVFKADGSVNFKKTLQEINTVVMENKNAFNLAKNAWDENTTSIQKLTDRQKFLISQTDAYKSKVSVLEEELNALEKAENRNEQAIRKKHNQLTQAQIQLGKYEKDLGTVTHELESGTAAAEEQLGNLADTMKDLTAKSKENESAFEELKSKYDDNTKSVKKYKDEQSYLIKQIDNYSSQVKNLEEQIDILENAENRNERAISEKRAELNQTKTALNNYKKELSEVNDELKFGTQRLEEYSKKVGETGKKITDVGKGMTAGITTPIAGIGVASANLAMDFESSMAKVSTIADETKVPIDDLKEGIKKLSEDTGQSVTDLSEGLYQAISASVDTGDAIAFMETATKAAVGGFTDNATAVDGLTSVLNAYGMEASHVDEIANQMLITQNLGKTTFGELAASIGQVAPVASALGISTEELLSSLAVTTAQGLGTSEAITALKASMSNIIKPSKEAAEAAEALGIDFSVSAVQSKGWIGFLKDVREGLKQASPEYDRLLTSVEQGTQKMAEMEAAGKKNTDEYKKLKNEVKGSSKELELLAQANDSTIGGFATMFGSVEGLNSVLMLTSEQGMQKYGESMETMKNNTTALEDAYKKVSETTGTEMQKAMNDIKNAGVEIGDILLPVISDIVGKIRDVVQAFSGLSDSQQETIVKIGLVAAAVGPLLMVLGSLCTGISGVMNFVSGAIGIAKNIPGILTTIGAGAKALWGIMAAHPLGMIITVIGLLVGAFIYLWNNCESFRNFWIGLWENIKQIVSTVVSAVVQFFQNLWQDIVTIFEQIRNTATEKWNAVKETISNTVTAIKEKVSSILEGIKQKFSDIWNNIKTTVSNLVDGIKSSISNGLQNAKDAVASKLDAIKQKFSDIWNGAKEIVSSAIEKIKGVMNFSWSLPKLKLPHISISGKFSINPPSVPKFGISWYAKGGILNQPTIFGQSGGRLLGGGEAGKEAVLPIHLLKDYIREENIRNNGLLVQALKEAISELSLVAENNIYIGDRKLTQVLTEMVLKKMDAKVAKVALAKGR